MAGKNQQIKNIRIDINTKGSADASKQLKELNKDLEQIQESAKATGGFIKGPIKALESLHKFSSAVSTNFKSMAKSASSVNSALNGSTKTATKNISNYMDNMTLVSLVLQDVTRDATAANQALQGVNASTGMTSLAEILKQIEVNTGKTSARVKQTRDNVSDLEVTAGRTGETIEELNHGIKNTGAASTKANKGIKQADKGLEGLGRTSGRTGKHLNKMRQGGLGLVGTYASVAATMFALTEAFRVFNDIADNARFVNVIQPQLVQQFGDVVGIAADQMVEFGIAYETATRKAAKAATFGLDGQQIADVVVIAKKASAVLGRDFAESIDRLTAGIAKQERELLDEFGIIVSLNEAQDKYAATLGKTRMQLSSYEKQQAFATAVTTEGLAKYENINMELTFTEKVLKDVTQAWQGLTISIAESEGALVSTAQGLVEGVIWLAREATGTDELTLSFKRLERAKAQYQKLDDGTATVEELSKATAEVKRLAVAFEEIYANTGNLEAFLKVTDQDLFNAVRQFGIGALSGFTTFDEMVIEVAKNVRIQSKSITGAWKDTAASMADNSPLATIITELRNYASLSELVRSTSHKLSMDTIKSYNQMANTIGMTADEARAFALVLADLQDMQSGSSQFIRDAQIADIRRGAGDADTLESNALTSAAEEAHRLQRIYEANVELQNRGLITAEKLAEIEHRRNIAAEKRTAEAVKLSRVRAAAVANKAFEIGSAVENAKLPNNQREQVAIDQEKLNLQSQLLEAKKSNGELTATEYALQLKLLEIEQKKLEQSKAAAPFKDATNVLNSLQQLEGLSDIQVAGLQIASAFTDTFALAAESGQSFTELLMKNSEAFVDFAANTVNALGSIFSSAADARIAGIDREIEAEKRRDGQSAKSLDKIKKLETKKIREKAKADKAQVVMSTSVAIMRAFSDLGWPAGLVAAGLAAVTGTMQLSQIDKAASGSVAALSAPSDNSAMQITGGTRDNSIDVSRASAAGELAFAGGRAGGGSSEAGNSILVGERGPELVTPTVPVNVTPSGESGGGRSVTLSPVLNINTIDAKGVAEFFDDNGQALWDGMEAELAARGKTLESL